MWSVLTFGKSRDFQDIPTQVKPQLCHSPMGLPGHTAESEPHVLISKRNNSYLIANLLSEIMYLKYLV